MAAVVITLPRRLPPTTSQDAVNDILVSVQEWTANPKTDASLGQVGR